MPKFINPAAVVAQAGISAGQIVADLGCGSGFYVLPAAQLVGNNGVVYAVDVVESKLAATASIASQFGYKNIKFVQADLSKPFTNLADESCDIIVVANILHEVRPLDALLRNAYRLLKSGGKLLVVEWKKSASPIGPPVTVRIDPQALEIALMGAGFRRIKTLEADGYHYAELFVK